MNPRIALEDDAPAQVRAYLLCMLAGGRLNRGPGQAAVPWAPQKL